MKKMLITGILLCTVCFVQAQQRIFREFFAAYAGRDGFTSLEMGEKMMKMMSRNVAKEDRELSDLFDGIQSIRVVTAEGHNEAFVEAARAVTEDTAYQLISSYSEEGQMTSFYFVNGGKFRDSEFLMLSVGKQECMVLDIYGEFDVKDISRLSKIRPQ